MEHFASSIRASVASENWHAAIAMGLMVPDICGWLEDPLVGSQRRYEAWFDRYLLPFYRSDFHGPDFTFLSAGDCYALRCALLHEGSDQVVRQRARVALNRFVFSTTGSHRLMIDDVLVLNVQEFCLEVCQALEAWSEATAANAQVTARKEELIRVRTGSFMIAPGIFLEA